MVYVEERGRRVGFICDGDGENGSVLAFFAGRFYGEKKNVSTYITHRKEKK